MSNYVTIYGIKNPNENFPKYIGQTGNSINNRLKEHIREANRGKNTHKNNWIKLLINNNIVPEIYEIEKVSRENADDREKYWISYYGKENLVNGTEGGNGVTEEFLKKISSSHLGQIAWNKGKSTSTEHLKEFQFRKGEPPINKGILLSEDVKNKISNSKIGVSIGKTRKSKSKYLGVTYEEKSSVWISQIRYMKKSYFIGRYKEETHAGIGYDIVSIWISKSIRNLNFPDKIKDYEGLRIDKIKSLSQIRIIIKKYIGGKVKYDN